MFKRYNCTYCGEPSDTMDHVIPHSLSGNTIKSYNKTLVVPCCHECNCALGNKGDLNGHFSISTKADWLEDHYNVKYRDYVYGDKGDWDEEDLEDFSGNLLIAVTQDKEMRNIITDRMNWLSTVSMMDPSIEDVWESIEENG